jgi:hypothetical protein
MDYFADLVIIVPIEEGQSGSGVLIPAIFVPRMTQALRVYCSSEGVRMPESEEGLHNHQRVICFIVPDVRVNEEFLNWLDSFRHTWETNLHTKIDFCLKGRKDTPSEQPSLI